MVAIPRKLRESTTWVKPMGAMGRDTRDPMGAGGGPRMSELSRYDPATMLCHTLHIALL